MTERKHIEGDDCWCQPTVEYVPAKTYEWFWCVTDSGRVVEVRDDDGTLMGTYPSLDAALQEFHDLVGPDDEYRGQ